MQNKMQVIPASKQNSIQVIPALLHKSGRIKGFKLVIDKLSLIFGQPRMGRPVVAASQSSSSSSSKAFKKVRL